MKQKFKEFISVGVPIFGILAIISMIVYWTGFPILLPQVFVGLATIISITDAILSKRFINSITAFIWIINLCIWI